MKKKVLVIGLQGLGNLILSSPLLHSLDRSGVCEVSVLVHNPTAATLMSCYPFLSEVIVAGDAGRLSLLRRLRSGRFDAVVVAYPGGPRTSLLAGLSGAPLKVGHQGRQAWVARRFLDVALEVDPKAHDVDNNLALFPCLMKAWNLDRDAGAPDFTMVLPENAQTEAGVWLADRELDAPQSPMVGIAPGCGRNQAFKRWPMQSFLELAVALKDQIPESHLLWFFGPDEAELRDSL